jgi:DNA-binding transcriptional LysR family regulator
MQSHTKAAQALNLTQPAVSQHISRLEDFLNVKLLERSRGAVVLTQEAQALLPDFERLERSVDMIFDKARTVGYEHQQTVRIATPTSLVFYLLAPVLTELQGADNQAFPVIQEVDNFSVYDAVRAGEVDFALTSMTGRDAELSHIMLLKDRPCVVFPSGHEIDGIGEVEIDEILPHKLIRPPPGTAANTFIEACQNTANCQFTYAAETSRLMTMDVLVRAGIGIVILPGLSAHLIAQNNLKYRPLKIDSVYRSCRLIKAYGKRLLPPAQRMADAVQEHAKRLAIEFPDFLVS